MTEMLPGVCPGVQGASGRVFLAAPLQRCAAEMVAPSFPEDDVRRAMFVCAVGAVLGAAPIELRVSATVVPEPGYVRATAIVEPHRENRSVTVALDSGEYYRSSAVFLEGDRAARVHDIVFDHLPAGFYRVTATVHRSDGREYESEATVQVVGD